MRIKSVIPVLAACCLLLPAASARASCTISVSGVSFGTYNVFSTSPLDTTGSIVFNCDNQDKRIRITLSTGASGTYSARTMTGSGDRLRYNLFMNGYSVVWGDGSPGTDYYWDKNPPNNRAVTLTIFGRVFAQQDVRTGQYSDSIDVQIDF